MNCLVILLASCKEDQTTVSGSAESTKFVEKLLEVWDDGNFSGTHQSFVDEISKKLDDSFQIAVLKNINNDQTGFAEFLESKPFTL